MKHLVILAFLIPTPVSADWFDHIFANEPRPQVRSYVKRKTVRPHKPKPAPVARPHDHVAICLPTIRVVGSQWVTEAGAEDSAKKAWMEKARWLYGESAMDLTAARDYAKRCSRSSIGEGAGQTQHRCEVEATPCRPGFEK